MANPKTRVVALVALAGATLLVVLSRPRAGRVVVAPAELELDVPCAQVEVVVLDDLPREELVVRVIEPRASGRIDIEIGRWPAGVHDSARFEPGELAELASGPYAAGTDVTLVRLEMDGFESLWLTERDLPPAGSDGRRVVELVPRPGWSARVQVVTGADEEAQPVSGIVLRFDEVETAASGDDGYLVHRAPVVPERIAVASPGWELVERGSYFGRGSVLVPSGRFTLERGELTVQLRRAGD